MGQSLQPGQADDKGGPRAAVLGQHDRGVFHQQDGGDLIISPLLGSFASLGHGLVKGVLGDGCMGVKGRQSVIRYVEQDPSCSLGVLCEPEDSGQSLVSLVSSHGRCFRQPELSCPPRVLQLVPGQTSSGSGRFFCGAVATEDLCISTSSSDIYGIGEDQQGSVHSHPDCPRVEVCTVVGHGQQHVAAGASQSGGLQGDLVVSQGRSDTVPPPAVVRPATHKLYKSTFRIFSTYCVQYGYNPTDCPVEIVTNFLAMLQDTKRMQYRTICGYRSAIARYHDGIAGSPLGSAKLIKRLTKACFNQNPPIPKYSDMWDADVLLVHLESMYPNSDLSIHDLGVITSCSWSSVSSGGQLCSDPIGGVGEDWPAHQLQNSN